MHHFNMGKFFFLIIPYLFNAIGSGANREGFTRFQSHYFSSLDMKTIIYIFDNFFSDLLAGGQNCLKL